MGSKSSSSSSSTTNNVDNRVAADNGAISLGQGATFVNEFPEEVSEFAKDLTDIVLKSVETSNSAVNQSIEGVKAIAEREQSSALFAQDLLEKLTPAILIVTGGFVAYSYFKGKR